MAAMFQALLKEDAQGGHGDARALELPQGVWRGPSWADAGQRVQATGYAPLDAELPGGGWPLGALTEVLLPQESNKEGAAVPQWPLVLPALASRVAQHDGLVMLVNPPHEPMAAALAAAGLPADRWCRVCPQTPGQAWWACEQALRCEGVVAVLAWLPHAPAAVLRRLHLAAAARQPLLWVFRPEGRAAAVARQASPAPLRLRLQAPTPEVLQVQVLKRRGPPLEAPVGLPGGALPWLQLLQAQSQRMQAQRTPSVRGPSRRETTAPIEGSDGMATRALAEQARGGVERRPHALDCVAMAHH